MPLYKFKLSPGQQVPVGSTGRSLSDGYTVADLPSWPTGKQTVYDGPPEVSFMWEDVENYEMTAQEIIEDSAEAREAVVAINSLESIAGFETVIAAICKLGQADLVKFRDERLIDERTEGDIIMEVKRLINEGAGR